jgi:hypothetical protein
MRNLIFASGVAISMFVVATANAGQPQTDTIAPVYQTQANPTGSGTPTDTPPNPPSASSSVPPAMPADPSYQAGPYKGALTPPPAEAMAKTYPLCTRSLQDSCVNPSEAAMHATMASPRHHHHRKMKHH